MTVPDEITPEQLVVELEGPNPPSLIDVREVDEREISVLPGDTSVPMSEFAARISELDPSANLVIYCRTGSRSGRVVEYLRSIGFSRVRNLATGINGWAERVDSSIRQY